MTQDDRASGRPSWSLSPQNLAVAYGEAQFMSSTGEARASGWFGPLAPLSPIAPPDVAGRQFDFPSGYNIATTPRSFEPISFHDLRALAESYDLLRLVIETRKDQIERLPWRLRVKAGCAGPDAARLKELTRFFERPDGEHDFSAWLRMLLEDLFVIDAPTLWRQRRRNGDLFALHPLDGATIKRVIDDWGRTPQPYQDAGETVYPAAFQQVLKGYPAVDYCARDIIYAPRNSRTGRVYGFSPVEQIVMTVTTALKRQIFTLSHFTEGNIPESLIGVPENWTPDQIKNFQDYWDAYFTGDLAARRRAKFVPGGVAKTFIQTKEPELKGAFDEWLARIVCYAFSVSPQALISQINRATGETQKEMAEEEGLRPILNWAKRLIDGVLAEDFDEPGVEFVFGQDERIDANQQAQALTSYVAAGILTRNEARVKLGQPPVNEAGADALTVTTGAGAVAIGAAAPARDLAKAFDPNQTRDENGRWTAGGGAGAVSEAPAPKRKTPGAQVASNTRALPFQADRLDAAGPAGHVGDAAATGSAILGIGAAAYLAHEEERRRAAATHADEAEKPEKPKAPPKSSPSSSTQENSDAAPGIGHNRPPQNPEQPPPPFLLPPTEPADSQRRHDTSDETPRKPSYQIGASDGGPGEWTKVNEGLTPEEAAYQRKATGAPQGTVYNVPNPKAPTGVTSFDGYDPATNTLIDAKYWNKWPIDEGFSSRSVIEQARSQINAAKGTNIVWKMASPQKAASVEKILNENRITGVAVEFFRP